MSSQRSGPKPGRITIENVNHPGTSSTVDAGMYHAMRDALLKVPADQSPRPDGSPHARRRSPSLARGPLSWRREGWLVVQVGPARSRGQGRHHEGALQAPALAPQTGLVGRTRLSSSPHPHRRADPSRVTRASLAGRGRASRCCRRTRGGAGGRAAGGSRGSRRCGTSSGRSRGG